ncbi:DNA primase [Nocardioides sp.]|uniref:DNA primase n=1 Tax=Nocardioides sp. TaxID=35761 RepID=UPI00351789D4
MAGRIREDDIQEVRDKVRIEEVIGEQVTLRNAGGGNLKGLCPFHDEKSPSFNVTPSRKLFHCFGCQESGDTVAFVMKIDGLTFTEAIERLADRVGVQLRRVEDDSPEARRPTGPPRQRLLEVNRVAAEFYAEQLGSAEAVIARQFLSERGFDADAARHFGLGYAPRDGEAVLRHLRGRRFTDEESVAAGVVARGRSAYDRFRGRLLWPIREPSGATLGFGARRLFDDDKIEAKYLNTPETALYKKSQVLYGIDLARTSIGRESQAVVVEGYTDVLACHLAGITTAVASCGTAFGEEHTRVLRRFLLDQDELRGEVIFTFDGDAAGQNAALKTFKGDHRFVAQTYVAVEPEGLDPCDLRIKHGDDAVRALVANREPLYRFVLRNVVSKYDLDRADARIAAVREAASLVVSSRDSAVAQSSFARDIAALTGVDPVDVQAEVTRAARRPATPPAETPARPAREQAAAPAAPAPPPRPRLPDPRDPRFLIERETLKLVLQHPMAVGRTTGQVSDDDFTHPAYQQVWRLVMAAGGPVAGVGDDGWAARVRESAADEPALATLVGALAVEEIPTPKDVDRDYVLKYVVRLLELTTLRRIAEVKSRLQRTDPVAQEAEYHRMFEDLAALENHRRVLLGLLPGGQ